MKSNLIELGHCSSAHGIKGALALRLYNEVGSILHDGMKVTITPSNGQSTLPQEGMEVTIEQISFGNKTLIYFKEFNDRTEIEKIIPFVLSVTRDHFPETDEDEIYLTDLIGMQVYNQKGKLVGKIKEVANHGSSDIIVITLKSGEELSLPFIKEFFPEIDFENKKVTIQDVEYL